MYLCSFFRSVYRFFSFKTKFYTNHLMCVCVLSARSLPNHFFHAIFSSLWKQIAPETDSHLINNNTNKGMRSRKKNQIKMKRKAIFIWRMTLSMCAINKNAINYEWSDARFFHWSSGLRCRVKTNSIFRSVTFDLAIVFRGRRRRHPTNWFASVAERRYFHAQNSHLYVYDLVDSQHLFRNYTYWTWTQFFPSSVRRKPFQISAQCGRRLYTNKSPEKTKKNNECEQ